MVTPMIFCGGLHVMQAESDSADMLNTKWSPLPDPKMHASSEHPQGAELSVNHYSGQEGLGYFE